MLRRIAIVQGHPNPVSKHFCHALADAYAAGAAAAGHETRRVTIAALEFPLLASKEEWETGALPAGLESAQAALGWADHIVFIFPLWLGTMPAILKAFLEQVFRPNFAFKSDLSGNWSIKALQGKSARLVVTMGMPAFWYRWYFRAHGVRGLERNVLRFCGIDPVKETLIGLVESKQPGLHAKWLEKLGELGCAGE